MRSTCLSVGAETDKRRNPVETRGAKTACCRGAVVDVLRAVSPAPTIHTHTLIAANQIAAGPSILTGVWLQAALVYIFCAVLACAQKCRQGEIGRGKVKLFPFLEPNNINQTYSHKFGAKKTPNSSFSCSSFIRNIKYKVMTGSGRLM